jgi:Spx/MgsR family transcriptional regulator
MLTIFGIPNCDTCRKARKWLESAGVEHRFHDVREDGLDRESVARWEALAGWKKILNTRSTAWRSLSDAEKADIDADEAIELILAHPTLLKRPVADDGDVVLVGFSPDTYATLSR